MRLSPFLRTLDILMVAFLVATVAWTFKVKNDSQVALERVAELEKQLEAERTEIDLLKSDWALLTSPARLQKLAERYGEQLGLEPAEPIQSASPNLLPPLRQMTIPEPGQRNALRQLIDENTKTGGIPNETDGGELQ